MPLLPAAVLTATLLLLSACGSGDEVIVSDAGGAAPGNAPGPSAPAEPSGAAEPIADEDQPDLGEPDEVMAEIEEELDDEAVSGDEALDALEPLDEEPSNAEIRDARDNREDPGLAVVDGPRNEAGEVVELDEAASLACADVERALTAVDEGAADTAAADVASAADRAATSGIADIAAWSEPLGEWNSADGDPAVLLGFLSSCTEGGYEL